jgi:hypothetical protein
MDRKSTLTKTAKGLMEATGKTTDLPRDLRNLLKEVDGKVTVGQLQMRQELFTEAKFMDALHSLERDGYVREMAQQKDEPAPRSPLSRPSGPSSNSGGEDLDFTAIASRTGSKQASDISRQIASERERVEAAARGKAEAEARAKREAEEQARKVSYESEAKKEREEMDRVHREAEERSRKAAEEKAKREAEERAKREAEERVKREAEERRRREADEKARREAEEKARRDSEERAKREAAERARREAEERAKREVEERRRREEEERRRREEDERRRQEEERRRREDEERVKREAAERARREEERRRSEEDDERRRKEEDRRRWEIEAKAEAAELEAQIKTEREAREAKARAAPRSDPLPEAAELEAAMRAERAEAEERVRRENEERVRREEEERRREEEQSRLRSASETDTEEEIGRREEEMRRREKEEAERAKQEAKARAEADAKAAAEARKDAQAREKALQNDERRAKQADRSRHKAGQGRGYRRSRNVGKPLAVGLFLILVISVVVLHFVPIDPSTYEKSAQQWLGQPVRVGAVYVQLVPSPHLRFEKVAIGKDPQMRIPVARAEFAITALFDERKALRRIEIEGGTVPPQFLAALVSGAGAPGAPIGVQRVVAKGVKLDIPGFTLPELDIDADLDTRGAISGARLQSADRKTTVTLRPQGGRTAVELNADKFTLPFGGTVVFDEFSAKGTIGRAELALSEFEGRMLNGAILGNGRLRWGDAWSLDGEFSVRQMDVAQIAAPVIAGGRLEGKGTYGMKAAAPDKLLDAARMEGSFTIQKGSITNVDMMRILQGSSSGGGTTLFSDMSASASADSGRIQLRQLRMAAGLLQAVGNIDIDSERNLSGRMQVELRAQTVQARATISVSGSVQNPQFRRVN